MMAARQLAMTLTAMAAACASNPGHAQIADYPTLDRVLFVEECIRAHPDRLRQEMLYKCACAMDALAEEIPYAMFTELATAANATTIAGERGNVARSDAVRAQATHFRSALDSANKACLISP